MVEIKRLSEYLEGEDSRGGRVEEAGMAMRSLLIELSRSGEDKGEIPREWILEVAASPYHEVILAIEDGEILGMATASVVFGAGIRKNAYLEDFVVSSEARGKGVGGMIWEEIIRWGQEKECRKLEFTSGRGREAAQKFYLNRGAEIYETNFFQREL